MHNIKCNSGEHGEVNMRYKDDHKEQTRQKILQAAAVRLRAKGMAASGVATLMGDVGLTQGGFYAHFKSKDALVCEALEGCMAQVHDRLEALIADSPEPFQTLLDLYLSPAHRDAAGDGCTAAALAGEMAQSSEDVRSMFTGRVQQMCQLIAATLPPAWQQARRQACAETVYAMLVGILSMARAVNDAALSDRLLANGKAQIRQMLEMQDAAA
jgi:TetR/AcrR family transcriptional repressor of nem operon